MSTNCLVTKLKAEVSNDNLCPLGSIRLKVNLSSSKNIVIGCTGGFTITSKGGTFNIQSESISNVDSYTHSLNTYLVVQLNAGNYNVYFTNKYKLHYIELPSKVYINAGDLDYCSSLKTIQINDGNGVASISSNIVKSITTGGDIVVDTSVLIQSTVLESLCTTPLDLNIENISSKVLKAIYINTNCSGEIETLLSSMVPIRTSGTLKIYKTSASTSVTLGGVNFVEYMRGKGDILTVTFDPSAPNGYTLDR